MDKKGLEPATFACFVHSTKVSHSRYLQSNSREGRIGNFVRLTYTMKETKEDNETEDNKQASADVLFHYSRFALACIGCKIRPFNLRLHLMKEISGMPSSLNRESPQNAASPDPMGESSSTGTARLDRGDSFRAL
uniref:Uncharacterized protein n=1 Tax=Phaseolus vulgaris TaxID=3885 RepID=V7CH09_PHAVU|nr:hypothetical protein PHAVU_003G264800g [Phaseolus vulgaris]ESW28171.1 hypothetical protein PHAVU_003G264800g [Phaseolus vulgaris]